MWTLEALGVARLFSRRLVAFLVVACFCFVPQFGASVIEQAAKERAQQITSLLDHALKSVVADSRQRRQRR
jgi:hypothetical protein